MPWIYTGSNQLDEIEHQLRRLERKLDAVLRTERQIMASEQELDQALTDLGTQLEQLQQAAASIIEKVSNVPGVDLTDELATLQSFSERVSTTTTQIADAVNPPDATAPAEPLPEEPPAEEPV